jgi:hypothetical protein
MPVTLVYLREERQISTTQLILKCTLFKNNLALLGPPYAAKPSVPITVFNECTSALNDGMAQITEVNFAGLSLLCAEFGFEALVSRLSALRSSTSFARETAETEARIVALEG